MRNLIYGSFLLVLICGTLVAQQNSTSTQGAPQQPAATPADGGGQNDADPLLDLPPLPKGNVSLIGGTVTGIDRVRNHLTVEPFGSKKKMKLAFDERTHIYHDGVEATQLGIKKGDRVYVDSQLVGSTAFARNIRVENSTGPAFAQGQIASYDAQHGRLLLKDRLSSRATAFRVTPQTVVKGKATSASELKSGSLVAIQFAPGNGKDGGPAVQELTVEARPGETFSFIGPVTHLDLRSGLVVVRNETDGKTYDIRFDPGNKSAENVGVGSEVRISAEFDGTDYRTGDIQVTKASESPNAISKKQ